MGHVGLARVCLIGACQSTFDKVVKVSLPKFIRSSKLWGRWSSLTTRLLLRFRHIILNSAYMACSASNFWLWGKFSCTFGCLQAPLQSFWASLLCGYAEYVMLELKIENKIPFKHFFWQGCCSVRSLTWRLFHLFFYKEGEPKWSLPLTF